MFVNNGSIEVEGAAVAVAVAVAFDVAVLYMCARAFVWFVVCNRVFARAWCVCVCVLEGGY